MANISSSKMNIENIKKDVLDYLGNDFFFNKYLLRGILLTDNFNNSIIIDNNICDETNSFTYNEYTKEQNSLMSVHNKVYRFVIDNEKDFEKFKLTYSHIQNNDFNEDCLKSNLFYRLHFIFLNAFVGF
ncbi:hypothetical protein KO488_12850 [Poseidonibacter lekithochrous]|uniref:hypothetical protein n=1 Tax=Poseidonibacter TaxID=2321187 RepID=UPI001C0969CE|nr:MULTISPECIES: hypothetical protein [Poseidonibacter]MBU3015651.1 hypothetical protein [Poseidonibacter lekithochrous]MDO6828952.1 hypothetical protein [Poseidonibacter sp. 1_MG-2023]